MSQLVKVPFHEGEILAAVDERGEWVVLKPLCEALGIDDRSQRKRIMRQAWGQAAVAMMTLQLPGDGQGREVFCLHRKRVGMWLANLEVSRVKEAARPYLAALQIELADCLDAYFSKKKEAPPAEPEPADAMDLIIRQSGLITAVAQRIRDQDRRISAVETHVAELTAARTEAAAEMTTVERSAEKPAELTQRMKVVRLHRAYCTAKGADFQETWRWLYRELRDRYHFDAKVRAENRKCSTLDVIEQEGLMGALFVLASDLLVVREVAAA